MPGRRFNACLLLALTCSLAGTSLARGQSENHAERATHAPTAVHTQGALIDVNHASLGQLMLVPGITPVWAARILRYRPYRTKEDLLDHGIVPANVYDRIRDCIIAHRTPQ